MEKLVQVQLRLPDWRNTLASRLHPVDHVYYICKALFLVSLSLNV